jgi:hypothetical protein
MTKLNKKQIIIIAAAFAFFAAAVIFVYLKQLRIEMTAEAGVSAGIVIRNEQQYFNKYGEFAALEERSASDALGISLEQNQYFNLMKIDVIENTVMLRLMCVKGFFNGTQVYVRYNNFDGITEYTINEKTKIPLPRL